MTLQQLRYAVTVCEEGSFNRASDVLYVSQPSLSGSVAELEKELGFAIFTRSGRGVTLTSDGEEFMSYARQVLSQYENLLDKYGKTGKRKQKFGVSTQHYSFAVKSFVEMVKKADNDAYEFAIRETKTLEVIDDVRTMKSEIGIIYLSEFNRTAVNKLLNSAGLEFHRLIDCKPYVYIWKEHPLANEKYITIDQLRDYPSLSFEQGGNSSFYYAEEVLSANEYQRSIKANDRATMLNLMVGLNGYTLCSGIICEELNGSDYVAVPLRCEDDLTMQIGYIINRNARLSPMGELYISEIKKYLGV